MLLIIQDEDCFLLNAEVTVAVNCNKKQLQLGIRRITRIKIIFHKDKYNLNQILTDQIYLLYVMHEESKFQKNILCWIRSCRKE